MSRPKSPRTNDNSASSAVLLALLSAAGFTPQISPTSNDHITPAAWVAGLAQKRLCAVLCIAAYFVVLIPHLRGL